MLKSDYSVLSSTIIALNNFIRYSYCEVLQLFRLTSLLIKAFIKSITKHRLPFVTYHLQLCYVGFSDQASQPPICQNESKTFVSFSCGSDFFYDCKC